MLHCFKKPCYQLILTHKGEKNQPQTKQLKGNLYFKEKDRKRIQSSSFKIVNRKLLNIHDWKWTAIRDTEQNCKWEKSSVLKPVREEGKGGGKANEREK